MVPPRKPRISHRLRHYLFPGLGNVHRPREDRGSPRCQEGPRQNSEKQIVGSRAACSTKNASQSRVAYDTMSHKRYTLSRHATLPRKNFPTTDRLEPKTSFGNGFLPTMAEIPHHGRRNASPYKRLLLLRKGQAFYRRRQQAAADQETIGDVPRVRALHDA